MNKELKSFNINGYNAYYLPDHHLANKAGIVYEHILKAEGMLGRKLRKEEVVHHKDKNRNNNSFDNLMVFRTKADHTAFHQGCEIKLVGDVYIALTNKNHICPLCGNKKDHAAKLCIDCYKKDQAKNIPTKDMLLELLYTHNLSQISRMFNVSFTAVKKWCKKYQLPYKVEDITKLRKNRD